MENKADTTQTPATLIPTREQVESLAVGDLAMDCFGHMSEVVDIYGRGNDVNGKAYVCFRVKFGADSGTITASLKEGRLVRTTALSCRYTSRELDIIERDARGVK